jgi:hypothetical protein
VKLSRAGWYWSRLGQMSTRELVARVQDQGRRWAWARRQVHPGQEVTRDAAAQPVSLARPLPPAVAATVPIPARHALVEAADDLLLGRWEIFGAVRHDLLAPDWFTDPITGVRAPQERIAFAINPRSEAQTGNVKQVWELSRHHHLTVLAAAWFVTGDARYAELVDRQLRSWWHENPFLSGVHWTSGIEIALRLISWTWVRRLLDGWTGVTALFEGNEQAIQQLYWHQQYLAAFRSCGSSANNHVIAEAAGQLVASCAFPWFPESARWRDRARRVLEQELERNTFPSGVNRELASDYHCFVAELGLIAAIEADAGGHRLSDQTWNRLCQMVDTAAAIVDEHLHPPRQGDGDNGRALLLDGPGANPWGSLLAAGAGLFGVLPWWPPLPPADVRSTLLVALADHRTTIITDRPRDRPSHFADAGLTLLRTRAPSSPIAPGQPHRPEIWCRCDGGPHGYLSIAAHAHADALSIEVRHGGVEVLVDPGTYCYHGEPRWRAYFRSTLAHNTLELDGRDQSVSAGPFLWVRAASTRQLQVVVDAPESADGAGGIEVWSAEHDGYRRLDPPAVHRRTVQLDRGDRCLEIRDTVVSERRHPCRLAFHLGPLVDASLVDGLVHLTWPGSAGPATGLIRLPGELRWELHRGDTNPPLGWYSSAFGRKTPITTLIGIGSLATLDGDIRTIVEFPT